MTSDVSMTSAMAMDTRHLEVHVFSRAIGKVVTMARCAITVINKEAHVDSGRHHVRR